MTSATSGILSGSGLIIGGGGGPGDPGTNPMFSVNVNQQPSNSSIVEMGKQLLASSRDGETAEVSLLLSRGAPITTDWLGVSPLHLAAGHGHPATATVLMKSGCSRDSRTKVDKTPLHLAATEGHDDLVELLLKSGAEVDSKDMLRMTPLHWAVERGNLRSCEILIQHGADVNYVNKFGKCPLELASEQGRPDIFELLQNAEHIRAEAVAMMTDSSVSDPLTMAATRSITDELGTAVCNIEEILPDNVGDSASQEEAMKLLAAHGITLLPEDAGNSQLMDAAIDSRQTLTLTEAGKLALSSSQPSSPAITSASPPVYSQVTLAKPTPITKPTASLATNFVKVPAHAPLQTTKSIVINTSQQDYQSPKKVPRVIRVTPEQFAAIKAGKGPKISPVSKPNPSNVITLNRGRSTGTRLATPVGSLSSVSGGVGVGVGVGKVRVESKNVVSSGKTIKIVRLNPAVESNVAQSIQLAPKTNALQSTQAPGGHALLQKKLKEIEEREEDLRRTKAELLRQLQA